jgi:prevent-host-death family protein
MNENETIVSVQELRESLAEYLERVRQGESLLIIRRSKPIARITPVED